MPDGKTAIVVKILGHGPGASERYYAVPATAVEPWTPPDITAHARADERRAVCTVPVQDDNTAGLIIRGRWEDMFKELVDINCLLCRPTHAKIASNDRFESM